MPFTDTLSEALQAATALTFGDAVLHREGVATRNASGAVSHAAVDTPCQARLNRRVAEANEAGTVYRTEIIIQAGTLTGEPKRGNAITLGGVKYQLGKCTGDGIRSHWTCEVVDG